MFDNRNAAPDNLCRTALCVAMDNFTVQAAEAIVSEVTNVEGILQPLWNFLRNNYGHIMRSPLFPPFFALSIDYIWVIVFTGRCLDIAI
jgi:hypothetical protein